jgi:predicted nucleotide-binding protein
VTAIPDGGVPEPPTVFIGSSSGAKRVASYLKDGLDRSGDCGEVTVWTQGVFGVSEYVLDDLAQQASAADFAVLVVTPDDVVSSRGTDSPAPRDNVIFEAENLRRGP